MSAKRSPVTIDGEVIGRNPTRTTKPKIDLRNLQAVRRGMASIYRDMRAGRIKTQDGTRCAFVLGELVKLHAVIEAVHARTTDSKVGTFSFGRNTGALEALVMGAGIPLTRVSPITWRRYAGLAPGVGKDASIAAALRLHPSARPMLEGKQARHDRGDAVLIAGWFNATHGR